MRGITFLNSIATILNARRRTYLLGVSRKPVRDGLLDFQKAAARTEKGYVPPMCFGIRPLNIAIPTQAKCIRYAGPLEIGGRQAHDFELVTISAWRGRIPAQ